MTVCKDTMQRNCDMKIILLGESMVGKTSLLLRFVSRTFKESLQRTTVDNRKKIINVEDIVVNLTIWDTAGQEMYHSLIQSYYRIADGVLLVYDVQNANTFMELSKWLINLQSINEKAEVLIAGNKAEDRNKKKVNVSMVGNFARQEKLEHVEVSAKSGENVDVLFLHLVRKILAVKGILPYSKDNHLLRRLEQTGEYISPSSVPAQPSSDCQQNAPNISEPVEIDVSPVQHHGNKQNCRSASVPKSVDSPVANQSAPVPKSVVPVDVDESASAPTSDDPVDARHSQEALVENDWILVKSNSPCFSTEDLTFLSEDTQPIESADCAIEFFHTLGEGVQVPVPEESDVIRLHERRDTHDYNDDDDGCC